MNRIVKSLSGILGYLSRGAMTVNGVYVGGNSCLSGRAARKTAAVSPGIKSGRSGYRVLM